MAEEKKIVKTGVAAFEKHPKAPEWVIADVVISVDALLEYINNNPDAVTAHQEYGDQVKFTIKRSKEGRVYSEPNTYRKKES